MRERIRRKEQVYGVEGVGSTGNSDRCQRSVVGGQGSVSYNRRGRGLEENRGAGEQEGSYGSGGDAIALASHRGGGISG